MEKYGILLSWDTSRGFGIVWVSRNERYFLHLSHVPEPVIPQGPLRFTLSRSALPEGPAGSTLVCYKSASASNNQQTPASADVIVTFDGKILKNRTGLNLDSKILVMSEDEYNNEGCTA